jgi:putative copper export protein
MFLTVFAFVLNNRPVISKTIRRSDVSHTEFVSSSIIIIIIIIVIIMTIPGDKRGDGLRKVE